MAKVKVSEWSATPGSNTDIDGINIAENCPPSGINDAIREMMSQLKDFQTGAAGDSFNGPVGSTTPAAGAFTTLSASGAVTLSGGTANGVPYLNGSKVLTTGSALTFDGTNLGIGSASPTSLVYAYTNSGSQLSLANFYATGTATGGAGANLEITAAANLIRLTTGTTDTLSFGTNATNDRLILDASGNLGLGVTPSAWRTADGVKALQFAAGGSLWGTASAAQAFFAANMYYDSSAFKYISSTAASAYEQATGVHKWYTAPSGTAGNAITFTQAMTLDASGQLGVGTTSPAAKLHIENGAITIVSGGVTSIFTHTASTAVYGTTSAHPVRFFTSNTERARIDSDGYLRMASGSLGIQFNGDTAAANSLDDYEEGTFTPTIIGTTTAGTGTYSSQVGRYTKIGNRVFYSVSLVWSGHTGTGDIQVDGLPFTANTTANNQPPAAVWVNSLTYTANAQITALVNNNSNDIFLRQISSGTSSAIPMDTSASFFISGHYEV